jgi:hypothetical protein
MVMPGDERTQHRAKQDGAEEDSPQSRDKRAVEFAHFSSSDVM